MEVQRKLLVEQPPPISGESGIIGSEEQWQDLIGQQTKVELRFVNACLVLCPIR